MQREEYIVGKKKMSMLMSIKQHALQVFVAGSTLIIL